MAYNAFTAAEIDAESPLDEAFFTKMADNFVALQNGTAFSAGWIDQTAIGAAAVGQSEIKKTYQEISLTSATSSGAFHTGGAYGLGYTLITDDSANAIAIDLGAAASGDTGLTTETGFKWRLKVTTYNSGTCYGRAYYVNASPPYDLGDGEVVAFVYAVLDAAGNVIALNGALDPPWAHNGPTKYQIAKRDRTRQYIFNPLITAQRRDLVAMVKAGTVRSSAALRAQQEARKASLAAMALDGELYVELTPAMKNADMNLIPHPCELAPGQSVVLLDPMSEILDDFFGLGEEGRTELHNQIHAGNLILSPDTLNRGQPAGLVCRGLAWR